MGCPVTSTGMMLRLVGEAVGKVHPALAIDRRGGRVVLSVCQPPGPMGKGAAVGLFPVNICWQGQHREGTSSIEPH